MKIFGREPAQWIQLLGGTLMFFVPFLHLPILVNGAVLAVITAATGLATAATISGEQAAPLVAGFIKALFALALALHIALPDQLQAGVMIFVEGIVAWYLRTQVIAPVPPDVPVVVSPPTPPAVATTP